jgi:hypothetical protein
VFNEKVRTAAGFTVGDILRISCTPESAHVDQVTSQYAMLRWPWADVDPEARQVKWNGRMAFPREPDHCEWRNTPWRIEPDVHDLRPGDVCAVGIPPVEVRVLDVRRHDPPAELGWLPRPEATLGVVFLGDEDNPEAGFSLFLPMREPVAIEHVSRR